MVLQRFNETLTSGEPGQLVVGRKSQLVIGNSKVLCQNAFKITPNWVCVGNIHTLNPTGYWVLGTGKMVIAPP